MKLKDAFKPSIILSETHFPFLGTPGMFADAIERIANEGFFQNVEMIHVSDPDERRRIGKLTKESGLSLTYWLTMLLSSNALSLSTTDESLRKKTVECIKNHMEEATQCGVDLIAVASGPDPGMASRHSETEQFYISLCELCETAASLGNMRVIIEPMDREAHKNCLVGPTAEFVPLIQRVREKHSNIGVCWDSAHISLCDDDLFDSLTASGKLVLQMHLSNAVLQRTSPDFGDHHMPVGPPGFLTIETIAAIFQKALALGISGRNRPNIAIEVRTKKDEDSWSNVDLCANILQRAWDLVEFQEAD